MVKPVNIALQLLWRFSLNQANIKPRKKLTLLFLFLFRDFKHPTMLITKDSSGYKMK